MLAALKARAYASLGEAREVAAALTAAEAAFGRSAGQRGFFAFTEAQLAFYRAGSYARLGKPKDAQGAATDALALFGALPHYMDPALVRFDLASAHLRQHDVAEACRVGREALSIPPEHRTSPIARRARELLAELAPHEASREARYCLDALCWQFGEVAEVDVLANPKPAQGLTAVGLRFASGMPATAWWSFSAAWSKRFLVVGTTGTLELEHPFPADGPGCVWIERRRERSKVELAGADCFLRQIDHFTAAASGQVAPAINLGDSARWIGPAEEIAQSFLL